MILRPASVLVTGLLLTGPAPAAALTLEARVSAASLGGTPVHVEYDTGARKLLLLTDRSAFEMDLAFQARPRPLRALPEGRLLVGPGGGALLDLLPEQILWSAGLSSSAASVIPQGLEARGVLSAAVGLRGSFGVTGRPLDDADGVRGRWEWSFFSRDQVIERVVTDERRWLMPAPGGRTVALVGKSGVSVYDSSAHLVAEAAGHQRKVALSSDGRSLLLNPDAVIASVRFVSAAVTRDVRAGAAVHGVRLSPDGRRGMIWFADGVIRALDPIAGTLGPAVRVPDADRGERVFISSLHLEDDGTATVGLLLRTDPRGSYDAGWLARVRDGRVLWSEEHHLGRVSSSVPEVRPIDAQWLAVRDYEGVSLYRVSSP